MGKWRLSEVIIELCKTFTLRKVAVSLRFVSYSKEFDHLPTNLVLSYEVSDYYLLKSAALILSDPKKYLPPEACRLWRID
ncbi:hypothetical protein JYU34_015998 [Plutella xylostella]|uniref:Uncharacterized protein n=1 Tax=Plutella xylostella TaxID=51655 RepID=A0ABQ7Q695_PLUXY|nr:hypothetical protein JYU34_015998 [Plutella xylostella]